MGVGAAIGLGVGSLASSFLGSKSKEKAGEKAYGMNIEQQKEFQDKYLKEFAKYARWQPEERKGFMNAVSGIYGGSAKALKQEGAASAAARGTGGGAYGRMAERINREKLSQVAQALAGTYGPKGLPSAGPFSSVPSAPTYSATGDFLSSAGELGGKLTSMWAIDKWGSKLFPNTMGNAGMAMPSSWSGSAGAMF